MSFFKKALAKVGIGGVKVDLGLASGSLTAGEKFQSVVRIRGGSVEQQLQTCEICLYAEYTQHRANANGEMRQISAKALIQTYTLACDFTLKPGETRELPLTLLLPLHTPPKLTRESVWFQTRLDLEKAVDPSGKDRIDVLPDPLMKRILNAMERLGFQLAKSYLTENSNDQLSPDPFVQKLIYSPSAGYQHVLEAAIITPVWLSDILQINMEIKRRQGLLHSITGKDTVQDTIQLVPAEWGQRNDEALAAQLEGIISFAANSE
ncbi:sporulation protein [Paenibacillus abyssi]|uniref:Sporulation control protein Spo0M n=1 Tax=Paenibacillus abyssi TaxID=1340531 RepID=A0A917D116_9BACL|nr:sporulation protein [Paenibacillus abyssi]GGG05621.1 sporulation control protein Spo0M [Paenibacillus abyssi]